MHRSEVVERYWRFHALSTSSGRQDRLDSKSDFDAWEHVEELAQSDPEECLAVMIDLAAAAGSDRELAYLGAGPLEHLLHQHPGHAQAVSDAARRAPSFRAVLRCVADSALPDTDGGVELRQLRGEPPG